MDPKQIIYGIAHVLGIPLMNSYEILTDIFSNSNYFQPVPFQTYWGKLPFFLAAGKIVLYLTKQKTNCPHCFAFLILFYMHYNHNFWCICLSHSIIAERQLLKPTRLPQRLSWFYGIKSWYLSSLTFHFSKFIQQRKVKWVVMENSDQ